MLSYGLLTRALGPKMFGYYAIGMSFIGVIVLLNNAGIPIYGIEKIAKNKNDYKKVSSIYSQISFFKIINNFLIYFCFTIIVFCFSIVFFDISTDVWPLLFLPILNCFSVDWVLQGLGKSIYPVLAQFFSSLFFLIFVFVFVECPEDLLFLCIGSFLSSLLCLSVGMFFCFRFQVNIVKPKVSEIMNIYKSGLGYNLAGLSSALRNQGTSFIVGFYSGPVCAAFYAAPEKIYLATISLILPINRILFPYMVSNLDFKLMGNIIKKALILFTFSFIVVITQSAKIISIFFGNDFIDSANVLIILYLAFGFSLFSNIIGFPVLGALGHSKIVNSSCLIAIIFFVIFMLIFGIHGNLSSINASILLCLSLFVELVIRIYYIVKYVLKKGEGCAF
jgi:PST family polysaccharide transporter